MFCSSSPQVGEGKDIDIDYAIRNVDGDLVNPVTLRYKLSDGIDTLIDWTATPLLSEGTITIPGQKNRVIKKGRTDRYFTLYATYGTGNQNPETIQYSITDSPNIDVDTPPVS